jgi:hypothetical protein
MRGAVRRLLADKNGDGRLALIRRGRVPWLLKRQRRKKHRSRERSPRASRVQHWAELCTPLEYQNGARVASGAEGSAGVCAAACLTAARRAAGRSCYAVATLFPEEAVRLGLASGNAICRVGRRRVVR